MILNDILAAIDDNEIDEALDLIEGNGDRLDHNDCMAIYAASQKIDPTFSGVGAEIRDTMRNNTDFDLV
jgi:hypothetical protein